MWNKRSQLAYFFAAILLSGGLVFFGQAQAQTTIPCPTGLTNSNGICLPSNPVGSPSDSISNQSSFTGLALVVIKWLLTISGVIAILFIIVGGFQYITSAGNSETAEKGKGTLINAVIGLIVVLLSYTIVSVISGSLTTSIK